MAKALGIISYNDSSVYVAGMQNYRPVAAFNFMGRYRLVDFPISNMTNSGMDEIQLYVNGNPKPLIEHIGRGRQYNINSKHGKLEMVPLYKENGPGQYTPDIEAYYDNLHSAQESDKDYVVIAPANIVYKCNYDELLDQHIESGADISILYQNIDTAKEEYIGCDVLQLNHQKGVESIDKNLGNYKNRALSLATYIMSKELFIYAVETGKKTSSMYWFKDVINDLCADYDIRGVNYRGTIYYVYDLPSFFKVNLETLEPKAVKSFADPKWPIYTRTYDSSPTIYTGNGTASKSLISNSCEIAGTVKNSVVGRAAVIGKDAVIENCLILPEAKVAANAVLKNVIVDKHAHVIHKKELIGTPEQPLYVARRENV